MHTQQRVTMAFRCHTVASFKIAPMSNRCSLTLKYYKHARARACAEHVAPLQLGARGLVGYESLSARCARS